MDDTYDVIVLGTGLVECVLSGLLSVDGMKVLHLDRQDYYGGASASLNLEQLWKHCGRTGEPPASLGRARDYNIDIIPKFIMSTGKLVKILLHTDVTRYLEFKAVDGSYVCRSNAKALEVHKVPATEKEALTTKLMGTGLLGGLTLEKKRFRDFLVYCDGYKQSDPATHNKMDATKTKMSDLLKIYKLEPSTVAFIGHALALYTDDSYLDEFALESIHRIKLYAESVAQYGKSPYIYPLYGLGELPQGFARLAAIYGGTYMLNKPIDSIVYDGGIACGVKAEGEVAKAKIVVGDPSYFQDKVKKTGQVVRCFCILNHPIPNTADSESAQIIIPQHSVGRKSDIYVLTVSHAHNVAPKGKWVAIISTTVETSDPHSELRPALDLLGPIEEKLYEIVDTYAPTNDSSKDKCFISHSYDATSHFESACNDIMRLYKEITGKDVDLTPAKKVDDEQIQQMQEQEAQAVMEQEAADAAAAEGDAQ